MKSLKNKCNLWVIDLPLGQDPNSVDRTTLGELYANRKRF